MSKKFFESLLGENKIGLVDVGASGGLESRWSPLSNHIHAFLFDPDSRAFSQLLQERNDIDDLYNIALSNNKGVEDLYLCRKQTVSSLLEPNRSFLDNFADPSRFDVMSKTTVNCDSLDNVILGEKRDEIDFIKLDTQGTELKILDGARKVLEHPVIGLEVEVEFVEMYKNQSLFGAVHESMIPLGFEYLDFTSLVRWDASELPREGQLIFGDVLLVRPPAIFANMIKGRKKDFANSKSVKYIALCFLYQRYDLVRQALVSLEPFLTPDQNSSIAGFLKIESKRQTRKNIFARRCIKLLLKIIYGGKKDFLLFDTSFL